MRGSGFGTRDLGTGRRGFRLQPEVAVGGGMLTVTAEVAAAGAARQHFRGRIVVGKDLMEI
jgi:hypothetical protein